MKRFIAEILNTPMLVEEGWLEQMVSDLKNFDPKSFMNTIPKSDDGGSVIEGSVGIIPIHGPIFARPNVLTQFLGIGTTLTSFSSDLQSMLRNPEVSSIVFNVDSPGGTVTGVHETANAIKAANEIKPTTAYVSGTAASAAYWMASAAGEIVLDATSRAGSIGVVVAMSKQEEGTIEFVNSASPNKRPDPESDQGRAVITAQLDDLANVFIESVAENRKVSTNTVMNDFGKGGILIGQKAVNAGMADRLGSFEGLVSTNNSTIGENYMTLTIDKLKADHKDIYDQVVATVDTTAIVATAVANAIAGKDAEIAALTAKLATASTTNTALEDRVKAIERAEVIRTERQNQEFAATICAGILATCTVTPRMHDKIKAQVNYESFMKDGVFDSTAFTAAFTAEVEIWEKEMGATTVHFGGIHTRRQPDENDPNAGADNDAVTRMLASLGITKKEA